MKSFYRLLNYEFSQMFTSLTILYFGVLISPVLFLSVAARKSGNVYGRFEELYSASGCIIVFILYFFILCGIFIKNIYSNYWRSKSIYTLLTLPVKRVYIYLSKLTAFLVAVLGFIASQFISYILSYHSFATKIMYQSNGETIFREMNNGLFLSLIRSDFMSILLPKGLESAVSSFVIFISIVCAIYYGVLCERSKKYRGFAFITAASVLIIKVISYRLQALHHSNYTNTYPYSVILFLLSIFLIWRSIKLVKRGAIA